MVGVENVAAAAQQAVACLWAVVVFALILFCPGYLLCWLADLFDFRSKHLAERVVWSVPLSFCVVTILSVLVGRFVSVTAVGWLAILTGTAFAALLIFDWDQGWFQRSSGLGRSGWIVLSGLAAWVLLGTIELIDIPAGTAAHPQLLMSVVVFDHALRTAFVDAVARTGVPPMNPLYWPGQGAPMRYYYFWYVLCAVTAKLAGVTARTAFVASCLWSGFGLSAVAVLFVRYFQDHAESVARKTVLLAFLLLGVTGLDLIPYLGSVAIGAPLGDTEWWSTDLVCSWLDTLLWAPHHMASLICCLTGFLLIWMSREGKSGKWSAALAGTAFASAAGLSVWVAIAFAILMLGWQLRLLVVDRRRAGLLAVAGIVATLLLLPYLQELRTTDAATARTPEVAESAAPHLLGWGIRRIIPAEVLDNAPGFRALRKSYPRAELKLAGVVMVLPGYGLELGIYALVLCLGIFRWRVLGEADRTAVALSLACLLLTAFVRSNVIHNNDFADRGTLIAQFFLLLLATRVGILRPAGVRATAVVLIAFGIAGTVAQAISLRTYLPKQNAWQQLGYIGLAERNAALQEAFTAMDRVVPIDAVIAYQPEWRDFYNLVITLNLNRQALNALPQCNTAFGGNRSPCNTIQDGLATIYRSGFTPATSQEATTICSGLHANYLIATRWDRVWRERDSWVWTTPATVATRSVRVVACGTSN